MEKELAPIIIAVFKGTGDYDSGNEKDDKMYYFTNVRDKNGKHLADETMCKEIHLLIYSELVEEKEYKLSLDPLYNSFVSKNHYKRIRFPIKIEDEKSIFLKEGNKTFKIDKKSKLKTEMNYLKGFKI